ncbi:MAG: 4'-phosphopantetheinyl transferase superfamily protein [Pseudomonadota bacterium]
MIGLDDQVVQLAVWRIDAEAPVPMDCLTPEDTARAAHFVRAEDRAASLAARAGLRAILGECLGELPQALRFNQAPLGKPFLAFPAASGVHFNLSHSQGLAALAVARFPIGVDIEAVRPVEADLAHAVFSPAELDEFGNLPLAQRREAFFLGWTRKEAVVKALGSGLHAPLDRFSVSLTPGQPARLLAMGWRPGAVGQWQMESFAVPEEHVGAIAADKAGWRLAVAGNPLLSVLGLAGPGGGVIHEVTAWPRSAACE